MTKYGIPSAMNARKTNSSSYSLVEMSTLSNQGVRDNTPLTIVSYKLNGHNYIQWRQSVLMYVSGKGKGNYLTGAATPPKRTDMKFKIWKDENNMVASWLVNSMTNNIGENFLLYDATKEIREAVKETYSANENTTELFEIKSIQHDLRQGDMHVTQYFNLPTRHW